MNASCGPRRAFIERDQVLQLRLQHHRARLAALTDSVTGSDEVDGTPRVEPQRQRFFTSFVVTVTTLSLQTAP